MLRTYEPKTYRGLRNFRSEWVGGGRKISDRTGWSGCAEPKVSKSFRFEARKDQKHANFQDICHKT